MKTKPLLLTALILATTATLTSCSITAPRLTPTVEDIQQREHDTVEAILNASPRVVQVPEAVTDINGLGTSLRVGLRLDTAEPLSGADLTNVVNAILNVPGYDRLNAIDFTAQVATNEDQPVNLEPAAEEAYPEKWLPYGDQGVTIVNP